MDVTNIQWTWVIVSLTGERPVGTHDDKVAAEFALSEEHYVVNMKTCTLLDSVGTVHNIEEQQDYKL